MNAKELGDMPAFPLPVIKDDKGHPMVHAHPYNQGMTVRQVVLLVMAASTRASDRGLLSDHVTAYAEQDADALLALLAKDTE